MGLVYKNIPANEARRLATMYGCVNYVETGTHVGHSLKWAVDSGIFTKCVGIEIEPSYVKKTIERVGLAAHVYTGDSVIHLPRICQQLSCPTLFWLDAHWSPDLSWDNPVVVCPLLEELRIIEKRPYNDVILIDDARMLGQNEWPSMMDLMIVLSRKFILTIVDDYISVVPR